MKLSKKISELKGSATLQITAAVEQMKSEGKDVISFTAGQLDFPTPEYIKEAGKKAIEDNFTKYTKVAGYPQLLEDIAAWQKSRGGLEYSPEEMLVSCGAKHSIYNILRSITNAGDEVIIFNPFWVSYPEMITAAHAKPVLVNSIPEKGFIPDLEELKSKITEKTTVIILNSPNNPTGAVYPQEVIEEIAEIVRDKNIWIISDEIYNEIVFDDKKHFSISTVPGFRERTIVINGVSKTFAMTGWRIGWAFGPKEVIALARKLQAHSTSNPSSISQKATHAAITGPAAEFIDMVKTELNKRRDKALEIIDNSEKLSAIKPYGAFYIMINVEKAMKAPYDTLEKFCKYLLNDYNVAVIPGDVFGQDGYVRMSIASSMENIERGLKRIEEAISKI